MCQVFAAVIFFSFLKNAQKFHEVSTNFFFLFLVSTGVLYCLDSKGLNSTL